MGSVSLCAVWYFSRSLTFSIFFRTKLRLHILLMESNGCSRVFVWATTKWSPEWINKVVLMLNLFWIFSFFRLKITIRIFGSKMVRSVRCAQFKWLELRSCSIIVNRLYKPIRISKSLNIYFYWAYCKRFRAPQYKTVIIMPSNHMTIAHQNTYIRTIRSCSNLRWRIWFSFNKQNIIVKICRKRLYSHSAHTHTRPYIYATVKIEKTERKNLCRFEYVFVCDNTNFWT